jgi:hypothetical protein
MSVNRSGRRQPWLLYTSEIRMSLRNNSGAYGYSVLITCTFGMLSALHSSPGPLQIFLFALGAAASFLVIEVVATNWFRRSLGDSEQTRVVALGSSLAALSISLGVGAAALSGAMLPATLSWFVGTFCASVVYLLAAALEMGLARRVEEARDLA